MSSHIIFYQSQDPHGISTNERLPEPHEGITTNISTNHRMAEPYGLVYISHDVIDDIFHQSAYARVVGVNYATILYIYG